MAAKIIEDDDIAWLEGGNENLLDPCSEDYAVDRSIENHGGDDFVMSQPGEEGEGFPMTVRHLGNQPLAARRPAMSAGHVGLDPGLVNEDQTFGIKTMLMLAPAGPEPGYL